MSTSEHLAESAQPVRAQPYDWPFDGRLHPSGTALLLIDWQVDFCGPGGYVDRMGYDLNLTRAGLACIAAVPDLQVIVGLLEPMIAAAMPAPAAPDAQVDRHV